MYRYKCILGQETPFYTGRHIYNVHCTNHGKNLDGILLKIIHLDAFLTHFRLLEADKTR